MNADQAKAIHLRDLLAVLGHQPVREQRGELWYLSPFRVETEESFKLTRDGRGWYDHGEGAGGNILDFAMRYYDVDFRGALRKLDNLNISRSVKVGDPTAQHAFWKTDSAPIQCASKPKREPRITDSEVVVTRVQPLQNRALVAYLKKRGIDAEIAGQFVQEMYYTQKGNPYFALAFANESGGHELRNPYFKGTVGSKDITVIRAGEGTTAAVGVFEGFTDFLSACTVAGRAPTLDCIVLNSVAMHDRAVEAIGQMGAETVHLYLDRDESGRKLTDELTERLADVAVHDESGFYDGYKDFNDYLIARQQTVAQAA